MELTPEFLGNSIVGMLITFVFVFAFNIFMAWLNWKQSKVNNQMAELLTEVKDIKKIIKEMKK